MLGTEVNFTLCLNSPKAFEPERVTRDPARGSVSRRSDIKHLEEEKQTLEIQLEEISAQLEGDGFTSVAQMRFVLFFQLLTGLKATLHRTAAMLPSSFFAVACQVCAAEAAAGEPSPERKWRASRSGQTWREQTAAEPEESDMGDRGGGRRR